MRKLIIGASIILIFIAAYTVLKAVSHGQQVKTTPRIPVAANAMPSPNLLLVTPVSPSVPIPESTPTAILVSTPEPKPLKSRVVKHQPDQFRKGAVGPEELSVIKKAVETIPWSRNSNPKAAADEDYAAIIRKCRESSVHDLLADLITEAVSNDYQPNNEAANGAYLAKLNSDFENGAQSDHSNGKSTSQTKTEQVTSVDSGLTPKIGQPDVQASATPGSPAQRPASAEIPRSRSGHAKHRSTVRHRIVDAQTRLLTLWHQSLAPTEKSPK